MTAPSDEHECEFPEIEILEAEPDDQLQPGMLVLAPCPTCGQPPREHLEWVNGHCDDLTASLLQARPETPLYHWAPSVRRKQIERYGLRPSMRATTSTGGPRFGVICLADTPSWAWALSGGMRWTPAGDWDLWQTYVSDLVDPVVLPSSERPSGIYEVRTAHRIYKRNLWLVATRSKVAP